MSSATHASAPGKGGRESGIDPNSAPGQNLTRAVMAELVPLVNRLAETQKTYGLSIIALGIQLWVMELRALDRKACGQYLRALADLMDPPEVKLRHRGKREFLTAAENRRRAAMQTMLDKVHEKLLAADLAASAETGAQGGKR